MSAKKPLATRLRQARTLLREFRAAVWESEKRHGEGPMFSDAALADLARLDAARQALTEAIRAAVQAENAAPEVGAKRPWEIGSDPARARRPQDDEAHEALDQDAP